MTKLQQAQLLIDYFSDKELTVGCFLRFKYGGKKDRSMIARVDERNHKQAFWIVYDNREELDFCGYETLMLNYDIIGHPVMISDVLDKIESEQLTNESCTYITDLVRLWIACGINQSLNQIAEKQPSDHNTIELFDFLGKIINENRSKN